MILGVSIITKWFHSSRFSGGSICELLQQGISGLSVCCSVSFLAFTSYVLAFFRICQYVGCLCSLRGCKKKLIDRVNVLLSSFMTPSIFQAIETQAVAGRPLATTAADGTKLAADAIIASAAGQTQPVASLGQTPLLRLILLGRPRTQPLATATGTKLAADLKCYY